MKKAAGFGRGGGWAREVEPPISRLGACDTFGTEIPVDTWRAIRAAFNRHGRRLNDLETSTRSNRNKNDPMGWHKRKGDLTRQIETALAALEAIDIDFLREAEENASLALFGGGGEYDCAGRLEKAAAEIRFIDWAMRHAEPLEIEIPSEAESRAILARELFAILAPHGANLSNGWRLSLAAEGDENPPTLGELTGFERLIDALEIHSAKTPAATAKWLRSAMVQKE